MGKWDATWEAANNTLAKMYAAKNAGSKVFGAADKATAIARLGEVGNALLRKAGISKKVVAEEFKNLTDNWFGKGKNTNITDLDKLGAELNSKADVAFRS